MGLKDDCLIPVWDKFRALVNLKYLITGIIAALIFVSMLSAAPTPWWVEETEQYKTRLFLNFADTKGDFMDDVECLYSDSGCRIMLHHREVDGHQLWPIYSAAQAFTIISIVLAFALSVIHFALAFVARFLSRRVMVGVNAFNIASAFLLCITTILPWVILMSLHTRAVRDAEGVSNDGARCTFYLHAGDVSAGGAACTFAGHQNNVTSGATVWKWEPTGGWILNCTVFWITLLTFLPANVLWVLNTGGKVARGRGKSIRRGRGMTSSRALSKQFELNKISTGARSPRKNVETSGGDSVEESDGEGRGGAINFGDDAPSGRDRAESAYDGGAINFSGNEAPRKSEEEDRSEGALTDSEEDD
ncbi:uncharacterized protein ACA1_331730 [Acanthamoeba castellanii str. Neff]|uniref:Uncharacterized protein n=1 Tax=Acanthamoeba castellanii (strain ATCC 30010 / Neff) TaxID=1257118 RepID=L8HE40_ACACF|nr:uncharacterized protein ACA1_331730 [Acanthamoeba castellanii str. Neff]ELR22636.1 hypothetical protein ACA1_331730 [Acanthamoeba castellanii str. Neff]